MAVDRYTEGVVHFDGRKWVVDAKVGRGPADTTVPVRRLLDLDGDGICEKLDGYVGVHAYEPGKDWQRLPFGVLAYEKNARLSSLRFLDLNGDGKLDLVFSNEQEYGVFVFADTKTGWKQVRAGKTGDAGAIPMIVRKGTNNGCWAHSGHLWWANEDTHLLKNHVDRRAFKDLIKANP
jgi:hypothetical protein